MMNFPTWPCDYPSPRFEEASVNQQKTLQPIDHIKKLKANKAKMSKKLSAFDDLINSLISSSHEQQSIYIEDIAQDPVAKGEFLNSLDDYLASLTTVQIETPNITVNLTKLAEGSFIAKSDSFIGSFDLDDVYSPTKEIPFPKNPLTDYYIQPIEFQEIAKNWNSLPEDSPF